MEAKDLENSTSSVILEVKTAHQVVNPTRNEDLRHQSECSKTKTDVILREKQAESQAVKNDFAVINVKRDYGGDQGEKICRICHLGAEQSPLSSSSSRSSELIRLGCGCKEELGVSHRGCAQTWFKQKGNRLCEICGKTATNITGIEDNNNNNNNNNSNNSMILLMQLEESHEMTLMRAALARNRQVSSDKCKRAFRNIVLACLLIAFVVPWLFRVDIF